MRLNICLTITLVVGANLFLCLPTMATRIMPPSAAKTATDKGMEENWRSSQNLASGNVSIDFGVADNGVIYDPVIAVFSGNDQYDAECLEALCGLSPLNCGEVSANLSLEHVRKSFGNTTPESVKPRKDAPEISSYLNSHKLENGSVVLHRIPPFVLSRYPGLITDAEFTAPKNLIIIPPDVANKPIDKSGQRLSQPDYVWAIRYINSWWTKHLQENGPVTRTTILKHAERVNPDLWGGRRVAENTSTTPKSQ